MFNFRFKLFQAKMVLNKIYNRKNEIIKCMCMLFWKNRTYVKIDIFGSPCDDREAILANFVRKAPIIFAFLGY